ncbi:hypothetical protein BFN10_17490 [Pseudomonas extremorientalis]|uniref:Filamentous hemagglutinin n=2 Tax=Pseudomonas extremorientalis TaxID=169669 RepID=A0A1S2TGC9_9PSED|nr:hypothetical protein BFN10_17490 [Pseudomonas extremorientalis]
MPWISLGGIKAHSVIGMKASLILRFRGSGAGKGEDNVSKGSSTLKALDAMGQFINGPTGDAKFGNSKQSSSEQVVEQTNRSSTLKAGNDVDLSAGNDVTIKGSQVGAGRDINIKGRDVTLDVAKGGVSQENTQSQSWGGIHGGSSGGIKVGVGGSHGVANEDRNRESATATNLDAGRAINLDASNDLNLIGTQAKAGRDIDLKAGNDLNIRSEQNGATNDSNRSSGGGEVGITIGSEGFGVYASVSLGKGNLERDSKRQQDAYLYAGDRLGFTSGKDTNIAGATLRGDEVVGRVGGDLNVASVADTGKVKGKEFDINATVTIGPGAGVSGSVGFGQTSGKTNWVEDQTRITAKDKVDIRTENHTQIDGALIASDTGNLKLDTRTLGFSDIAGEDKEHGYYLNVGGTFTSANSKTATTQDPTQVGKGKEGETSASISGWKYDKEREQAVRATVGAGDIVVRNDAETGADSTAGLNRDVSKAYEVTQDKESRTDLYVSSSSVEDALHPLDTAKKLALGVYNYDKKSKENWDAASTGMNAIINKVEAALGRKMDAGALAIGGKDLAENTLEALILSGKSRADAMAMMRDPGFQQGVLAQLDNIMHVNDVVLKKTQADVGPMVDEYMSSAAGSLVIKTPVVTEGEQNAQQATLTFVSNINAYRQAHPESIEAIGYVLALAQGPKGMMQLAVGKLVENTEYGEALGKKLDELETKLGRALAEKMSGIVTLDVDSADDQYLTGFKPGTITSYQQYYDKQGSRLKYEAGEWKNWE